MPLSHKFPTESHEPSVPCHKLQTDALDWTDVDHYVDNFKTFIKDHKLGKNLGFIIEKATIEKIMAQDNNQIDAIKVYVAYSPEDKTFRLVLIGSKLDHATSTYNDYNIPVTKPTNLSALPELGGTRPCPPECGTTNFLNKPLS